MKLYFLGGSFDPPHLGHFAIAKYCAGHADNFLLVPARQSPLKSSSPAASESHRLKMLEIMTAELPGCAVDPFELDADGPSYTIHTVNHLLKSHASPQLHLVMGADQLRDFHKWYRHEEILKKVKLVCFRRAESPNIPRGISVDFEMIEEFHWGQSSTEIRNKLKTRDPGAADDLLPGIYHYIIEHKLYL